MAILGVDDFKSKLRGGGARPNLFKATINFPAYAGGDVELTSFMCRSAQLPQSTVEALPVPFRGRILNVAGDRTFEPWNVTILNDTGFEVRDAMERWMNDRATGAFGGRGMSQLFLDQEKKRIQRLKQVKSSVKGKMKVRPNKLLLGIKK